MITSYLNKFNPQAQTQSQTKSHQSLDQFQALTQPQTIAPVLQAQMAQKIQIQNIETSQFNVEQQQNHVNNENQSTKMMQNIKRIIGVKKQTQMIIVQIQQYVDAIIKLQKENKCYNRLLNTKNKQIRELKNLMHIKDMQMLEINQQNQKLKRDYEAERKKNKIMKEEHEKEETLKWQSLIMQMGNGQNGYAYDEFVENSEGGWEKTPDSSVFMSSQKPNSRAVLTQKSHSKGQISPYTKCQFHNQSLPLHQKQNPENGKIREMSQKRSINISNLVQNNSYGSIIRIKKEGPGQIKRKYPQEHSTIL